MGFLNNKRKAAAAAHKSITANYLCADCNTPLDDTMVRDGIRKCAVCQLVETGLTTTEASEQIEQMRFAAFTEKVAANDGALRRAHKSEPMYAVTGFDAPAKYVTGPWNIESDTPGVVSRYGDNLAFATGIIKKQMFTLPFGSIRKLTISTVDQLPRVTAARLLLVGVFALAWKKGQRDKFLNIEFVDDTGVELSLVFTRANALSDTVETLQTKVISARHDYLKSRSPLGPLLTAPAASPLGGSGTEHIARRIEELAGLRDRGILTPDEFNAKKAELLKHF